MKINQFGSSNQVNPYQRQANKAHSIEQSLKKTADKLEISSAAKEMQQMSQSTPARQARVDELKIQVENGTYKINPQDIAKSIVNFYNNKPK